MELGVRFREDGDMEVSKEVSQLPPIFKEVLQDGEDVLFNATGLMSWSIDETRSFCDSKLLTVACLFPFLVGFDEYNPIYGLIGWNSFGPNICYRPPQSPVAPDRSLQWL